MSILTKEFHKELTRIADEFGVAIDNADVLNLSQEEFEPFGERVVLSYRKLRGLISSIGKYIEDGSRPDKGPAQPPKGTRP